MDRDIASARDWILHYNIENIAPYRIDSNIAGILILQWWNKNLSKKLSVYIGIKSESVMDILRIHDCTESVEIYDGTPDIATNMQWLLDDVENVATQD